MQVRMLQMVGRVHTTNIVPGSTTSEPNPVDRICTQTDLRGEVWIGTFGQWTEHHCSEGSGEIILSG